MGKSIGFEALHPPPFVIHANQQVGTQFFNRPAQSCELCPILPVAGKQNQTTYERMPETLAVSFG
jgi:hypothetical protein